MSKSDEALQWWKLDPELSLEKSPLEDFLEEHLWMLDGVSSILEDIIINTDQGAAQATPRGQVQISLDTLSMLSKTIDRALFDLRGRIDLIKAQLKAIVDARDAALQEVERRRQEAGGPNRRKR